MTASVYTDVARLDRQASLGRALWIGLHAAPAKLLGRDMPDPHCTVVHIGRRVSTLAVEATCVAADVVATTTHALTARVSGVARFRGGVEGDPLVVLLQSHELRALRLKMVTILGLPVGHPGLQYDYTPHVTVRYVARECDVSVGPVGPVGDLLSLTFSALRVTCGDESVTWPLSP